MKVMIGKMVGYWNSLKEDQSKIVYVGKWGIKLEVDIKSIGLTLQKKMNMKRLIYHRKIKRRI